VAGQRAAAAAAAAFSSLLAPTAAARVTAAAPGAVALDGTASRPVWGSQLAAYEWRLTPRRGGGARAASGARAALQLPPGAWDVTLTVRDDRGAAASDAARVTVAAPPATARPQPAAKPPGAASLPPGHSAGAALAKAAIPQHWSRTPLPWVPGELRGALTAGRARPTPSEGPRRLGAHNPAAASERPLPPSPPARLRGALRPAR
jgi:hypothetical protein